MTRANLKSQCLAILDEVAVAHGAGHQHSLAGRYVLNGTRLGSIEMMFEKGASTPANLWMPQKVEKWIADAGLTFRQSLAETTNVQRNATGGLIYGRHSALKTMRHLANADLICVTIEKIGDLRTLLARLMPTGPLSTNWALLHKSCEGFIL